MLKRAFDAVFTVILLLLPALGEPQLFRAPKLWLLATFAAASLSLQPRYVPAEATASDRGTARILALILLPLMLGAVLEARFFHLPAAAHFHLGDAILFALMTVGLAIRTWAVRTLGRYFTLHVGFQLEQPLIRTGPYRYVRHPSYTGALLFLLAYPLVLEAYVAFAIGLIAYPLWFMRRIRQEEETMRATLGPRFDAFAADTPPLIPRMTSRKSL